MSAGDKMPGIVPIGNLPIDSFALFVSGQVIKAYPEHNPIMYVDYETPKPGFTYMKTPQLHLGIAGDFQVMPTRSNGVKPHGDIYFNLGEIGHLVYLLRSCLDMTKNKGV